MKRLLSSAACAAALLAACAPPFARDLLDQVAQNVGFSDLRQDPERHRGALLMLGGMIVETTNLQDGTRIEVLQKPLDSDGWPQRTDETGGRFLVYTPEFLDTAVYHPGRLLTVIAEVTGQRTLPLGEMEYRYPELTARDVHLWSPSSGPRFSIGVGVYRGF